MNAIITCVLMWRTELIILMRGLHNEKYFVFVLKPVLEIFNISECLI